MIPETRSSRGGLSRLVRSLDPNMWILVGWSVVAVGAGLQEYVYRRIEGLQYGLAESILTQIPAIAIWAAFTPVVMALVARRPLWGPGSVVNWLVHLATGVAFVVALNLIITVERHLLGLSSPPFSPIERTAEKLSAWGPQSVLIYMLLVALLNIVAHRRAVRHTSTPPTPERRVNLNVDGKVHLIPANSIRRVEARRDYVFYHCDGEGLLVRQRFAEVESMLTPLGFVRVHRSHLVNPKRVLRLERGSGRSLTIVIDDGTELPVARSRWSVTKRALRDAPFVADQAHFVEN